MLLQVKQDNPSEFLLWQCPYSLDRNTNHSTSCTHNQHTLCRTPVCTGTQGAGMLSSSQKKQSASRLSVSVFFSPRETELCEGKKRVNVYNLRELSNRSHQFPLNLMTFIFASVLIGEPGSRNYQESIL